MVLHYDIDDVRPFISWAYFWHAWGMAGRRGEERDKLRADADAMLTEWHGRYHTHAVFRIVEANSDGDDIIADGVRLPMLRQQRAVGAKRVEGSGGEGKPQGAPAGSHALQSRPPSPQAGPPPHLQKPSLCLADFIRPLAKGADRLGAFAATVDKGMETAHADDPYLHLLGQTLAERLAEATAERLHWEVRTRYWGYVPDERLTTADLLAARYQGIRPAVGYPSMPDMSVNFLLDRLLGYSRIGITLTESGMMRPEASVSGLMLAHPRACYFDVGKIGDDQLRDYARRRGIDEARMRRFLSASIL